IRERVNAGLARAKERGVRLGRRPVKPSIEARIRELRVEGMGILKIGRTLGVGTSVVQRVLAPARPVAEGRVMGLGGLVPWAVVHGTPACGLSRRAGSANLFAHSSSRTPP